MPSYRPLPFIRHKIKAKTIEGAATSSSANHLPNISCFPANKKKRSHRTALVGDFFINGGQPAHSTRLLLSHTGVKLAIGWTKYLPSVTSGEQRISGVRCSAPHVAMKGRCNRGKNTEFQAHVLDRHRIIR